MLLGPYNGMLESATSAVLRHKLLGSLQGQELPTPAVACKDLSQGHSPVLGNLLPLTFPPETVQTLRVCVQMSALDYCATQT